jgi:hypothetical protein
MNPVEGLKNLHHPHLINLRSKLSTVITQDVAPSTKKKYLNSFKLWSSWACTHDLQDFPVKGELLSLYLTDLIDSNKSIGTLESVVAAIDWLHKKHLVPLINSHTLVKQVLASAKRILARPVVRKDPILPSHIRTLFDLHFKPDMSLDTLQTLTFIVVGFSGFLRFDDLVQIKFEDLEFHSDYCKIFMSKRKNDQYRAGSFVFLARSGKITCPVSTLEQFVAKSQLSLGLPLFRKISHGFSVTFRPQSISYNSARSKVLGIFHSSGLGHLDLGLHSLRSGGASQASRAGVPQDQIKRHGGWKSFSAHLGYIEDSLENLLNASRSLGI